MTRYRLTDDAGETTIEAVDEADARAFALRWVCRDVVPSAPYVDLHIQSLDVNATEETLSLGISFDDALTASARIL